MATSRPQGDLVGWRVNTKHFQLGKTIEISSLDKKKPIVLMPAVGFELTTSQSFSGDVTLWLAHSFNQSAFEDLQDVETTMFMILLFI